MPVDGRRPRRQRRNRSQNASGYGQLHHSSRRRRYRLSEAARLRPRLHPRRAGLAESPSAPVFLPGPPSCPMIMGPCISRSSTAMEDSPPQLLTWHVSSLSFSARRQSRHEAQYHRHNAQGWRHHLRHRREIGLRLRQRQGSSQRYLLCPRREAPSPMHTPLLRSMATGASWLAGAEIPSQPPWYPYYLETFSPDKDVLQNGKDLFPHYGMTSL